MKPMRTVFLIALALTGCAKKSESLRFKDGPTGTTEHLDVAAAPAAPLESSLSKASIPVNAPLLAYVYSFALQAPANKIEGLATAHEKACTAAGSAVCQVVKQSVERHSADSVSGDLTLKASAAWLATFKAGLAAQAKGVGGRVVSSSAESEDLTRQIVDTDAMLRAKLTLRDRLQTLLASHPGKVADLLDVERELARVQGEIDAGQSELNVMRGRVAMSEVNLSYVSEGVLTPQGAWSPLRGAIENVLRVIAVSLAAMITFVAAVAPWALVGTAVIWPFRTRLAGWRRDRRARKAETRSI